PVNVHPTNSTTKTILSLLLLLAQQELQPIQATEMLAIGPLGRTGRIPFPTDPIQLLIVLGKFQPPADGEEIKLPDGRAQTWRRAKAAEDEWFSGYGFQSGYARWTVDSPASRIALLEANGHGMVYANGEPRAGDPYGYGYVRLPVLLKKGQNEFLFATGRGRLSAKLAPVAAPYLLNTDDPTLPDAVAGKKEAIFGAVVLINATGKPSPPLSIEASWSGRTIATRTPSLPPLSTRKIRFNLPDLSSAAPGEQKVQVHLSGNGARHDSASVSVRVRRPDETRKITFVSDIDGSVQYYAIRPPQKQPRRDEKLPIVLSLHGASVEAINQADAYSPKDWCWIVCPTNRRPFGFDWEDWGRLDALEVLRHAQKHLNADFSRTYLTGHSMGGHGTWQLGVLYPDLFLAIAPSAGWRSFFTYGGKPRLEENATDIDKILARATASSDTEALSPNLIGRPVYILHGDADDNVPVTEARAMRDLLTKLGQPPGYHEQKGAGHWWDGDASPGADCVDWPAIFETFRKTPPTWPKRAEDVKVQRSFYVI
ncbi:MAG TPA: prolyl oligopeptidase family serine peptidase, partial [Fimbriimonadaceae bacterium]|nr:prolyl oligopeptidase family serine peptidase [Fimbriimonadaceae bacterium]